MHRHILCTFHMTFSKVCVSLWLPCMYLGIIELISGIQDGDVMSIEEKKKMDIAEVRFSQKCSVLCHSFYACG